MSTAVDARRRFPIKWLILGLFIALIAAAALGVARACEYSTPDSMVIENRAGETVFVVPEPWDPCLAEYIPARARAEYQDSLLCREPDALHFRFTDSGASTTCTWAGVKETGRVIVSREGANCAR
jgi:hypothetical protein